MPLYGPQLPMGPRAGRVLPYRHVIAWSAMPYLHSMAWSAIQVVGPSVPQSLPPYSLPVLSPSLDSTLRPFVPPSLSALFGHLPAASDSPVSCTADSASRVIRPVLYSMRHLARVIQTTRCISCYPARPSRRYTYRATLTCVSASSVRPPPVVPARDCRLPPCADARCTSPVSAT